MNALQQDLVPLTAAASDDQLREHLAHNWNARKPIQAALVQAYAAAKSQRFAPIGALDSYYIELERKIWITRQMNTSSNLRSAEDWNCEIRVLRLSLEGLDYFTAFAAKWEKMSDYQRKAEQERAEQEVADRRVQALGARHAPVLHGAPGFSAAAFLRHLDACGIRVAVAKNNLVVHGADKLTPSQRHTLKEQKELIIGALGSTETF